MRQIKEVEDVMARNAHWNPRSEPFTDRLEDADERLRRDLVEICEPWHERINWSFVAVFLGVLGFDACLVLFLAHRWNVILYLWRMGR